MIETMGLFFMNLFEGFYRVGRFEAGERRPVLCEFYTQEVFPKDQSHYSTL